MNEHIWDRTLCEAEWRLLLADPAFMMDLLKGIESMFLMKPLPGESLLIKNWPKEAHEGLLPMLPDRLADAFNLSAFRADGMCPYLDETEGFRLLSGYEVAGPAGFDENQLTPYGGYKPLGPYADIVAILRVPLPIRLDRTHALVRVMPDEGDLILMVGQFRCGQARKVGSGCFRVEEEVEGGNATVILADDVAQDAAADMLLAVGQRQVIELFPLKAAC